MNIPSVRNISGPDLPMVELFQCCREHYDTVWKWMNDKRIRPWLDFGGGWREISRHQLFSLLASPHRHARLFRLPGDEAPLGMVCLNDIDDAMDYAELWVVRDLSSTAPRNATLSACLMELATGFVEYRRYAIGAWIADNNRLSIRLANLMGMQKAGRQRARHVIDGRRHDRLLYDITFDEFAARYPDMPSEQGRTARGRLSTPRCTAVSE